MNYPTCVRMPLDKHFNVEVVDFADSSKDECSPVAVTASY